MRSRPTDPGLQGERTLFAWRRTCLAAAVAQLVLIRFGIERLGVGAVVVGLGGLALSAAAFLDAARRHRRTHVRLGADASVPPVGLPVTLTGAAVALLASGCLAWVVAAG